MKLTLSKISSTGLMVAAVFLMASGSLRDSISPVGYWGLWSIWAATIFAIWGVKQRRDLCHVPLWITASYGVLCLGMMVAAIINHDWPSAYQALKIVVIFAMFEAMWMLNRHLDWQQLTSIVAWVVAVALVSFALSRLFGPSGGQSQNYFPTRSGTFLATYGVLWKVGAFFLPLFLANAVVTPRLWFRDSFMIAASVFLVLADGSRTGILVLAATALGFVAIIVWRRDGKLLRGKFRYLLLVPIFFMCLQITDICLHTVANVRAPAPVAPTAAAQPAKQESATSGASITKVTFALESKPIVKEVLSSTLDTRMGDGDPARLKLLRASVHEINRCLPFGCGFLTTGTDIGKGHWLPVHNAYLAALGDFGILGLAGMMGFLVAAWLPLWRSIRAHEDAERSYFIVATAGSALAYGMALMLNTFTTEMSEWGYLILMLSYAWKPVEGGG